ncbi:MAG: hypothetical protein DHS20C18_14790 [Saprospiraceae bacterium]|nr:MAG: hypothetical protein DHS20C18_14790 [Saprospiraceae bacterium]
MGLEGLEGLGGLEGLEGLGGLGRKWEECPVKCVLFRLFNSGEMHKILNTKKITLRNSVFTSAVKKNTFPYTPEMVDGSTDLKIKNNQFQYGQHYNGF